MIVYEQTIVPNVGETKRKLLWFDWNIAFAWLEGSWLEACTRPVVFFKPFDDSLGHSFM